MKYTSIRIVAMSVIFLTGLAALPVFSAATNLSAAFRKGKTFITFTEESGTGKTYNLYRAKTVITDVTGLVPIANVPDSSAYDKRYGFYHVIQDTGVPLTDGTGLFVYTPRDTSAAYYAVTVISGGVESKTITSGQNSLSAPVSEQVWPWPCGVLRTHTKPDNSNHSYMYFYWMDYADWPNNWDYYGDLFQVVVNPADYGHTNVPLLITLHGCCATPGTQPSFNATVGAFRLIPTDNYNTYWYGVSNHGNLKNVVAGDSIIGYKEMCIMNYIHNVLQSPWFSIDTNRIYLSGQSMGGGGTMSIGFHNPGLFAALNPVIGRVHYSLNNYSQNFWTSWDVQWGPMALGAKARNGMPVYKWMDIGYLAQSNPSLDYPPLIDQHGSKDGLHPMYIHTYVYQTFAKTRHAIWGEWMNIDHQTATYLNNLPGGTFRFKKNELYPALTNASKDDRFGHLDSAQLISNTPVISIDSAGIMNNYIDWTSSLHKMGLANDGLIDCADSIVITLKSSRAGTTVDITPRRIQSFKVVSGNTCKWKNRAVSGGALVDSGSITVDANGLITVPAFAISATGSRLTITKGAGSGVEGEAAVDEGSGISADPNPFNPEVLIRLTGLASASRVRFAIYDSRGACVTAKSVTGHLLERGISWNAAKQPSGIYVVRIEAPGRNLSRKIVLIK